MPRRSPRRSLRTTPNLHQLTEKDGAFVEESKNDRIDPKISSAKKKPVAKRKAKSTEGSSSPTTKPLKRAKKSAAKENQNFDQDQSEDQNEDQGTDLNGASGKPANQQSRYKANPKPKQKAKSKVDPLSKWSSNGKLIREMTSHPSLNDDRKVSIYTMNMAGLRGVLNNPKRMCAFKRAVKAADADVLCIQEHKLQDQHVEDVKEALEDCLPGYCGTIDCSGPPARKGYSGVATFVKCSTGASFALDTSCDVPEGLQENGRLSVKSITKGLGHAHEDDSIASKEGRVVTVEFAKFFVVNVYTPNSGQKLDRLQYRTETWDKIFLEYVKSLEENKPVVVTGDLNCAHQVLDMHNFYTRPNFPDFKDHGPFAAENYVGKAKGLLKQAGCTVVERDSFTGILDAGLVDTFRHFHPAAKGCFSYWSIRAGNRASNKGLRLDYCLVSQEMCENEENIGAEVPRVVDAFICDDEEVFPGFSDHCPVGVTLLVG